MSFNVTQVFGVRASVETKAVPHWQRLIIPLPLNFKMK